MYQANCIQTWNLDATLRHIFATQLVLKARTTAKQAVNYSSVTAARIAAVESDYRLAIISLVQSKGI